MKIVMDARPRFVEPRPHWTVTLIRAIGVLQVIAATVASYLFLQPVLSNTFFSGMGETAFLLSSVLSVCLGLLAGLFSSALIFALAMLIDDMHVVRGYLHDMQITGKYIDE